MTYSIHYLQFIYTCHNISEICYKTTKRKDSEYTMYVDLLGKYIGTKYSGACRKC